MEVACGNVRHAEDVAANTKEKAYCQWIKPVSNGNWFARCDFTEDIDITKYYSQQGKVFNSCARWNSLGFANIYYKGSPCCRPCPPDVSGGDPSGADPSGCPCPVTPEEVTFPSFRVATLVMVQKKKIRRNARLDESVRIGLYYYSLKCGDKDGCITYPYNYQEEGAGRDFKITTSKYPIPATSIRNEVSFALSAKDTDETRCARSYRAVMTDNEIGTVRNVKLPENMCFGLGTWPDVYNSQEFKDEFISGTLYYPGLNTTSP